MTDCSLSFTIPVYNGAQTILETLESVQSECDSNCEIVVLDNCSTDATAQIVEDFQSKYTHVRYFRNSENLGYDRNFNRCFEEAVGDYVWIVGDDDLIRPGAVEKVREVLAEHDDLGFIYVNYAIVNRATNKISKERDYTVYEDRLFSPGSEAALLLQEYPNFISSLVFDRAAWLRANAEQYFDTLYSQYGVFLDVTTQQKSYCVAEPYVENKCRINNLEHKPGFYRNYLANFISLLTLIDDHQSLEHDKNSRQQIIAGMFARHFLKYVKVHKLMGGEFRKEHALTLWGFVRTNPSHLPTFLLYLIPGTVLRLAQGLRVSMRQKLSGKKV